MKTEFEKMVNGELYNSSDPDLVNRRLKTRDLALKFNALSPFEIEEKRELLRKIFINCKNVDSAYLEPNLRVEYGENVLFGKDFYMNFDCMLLDVAPIKIGDGVMFGPRVILATPMHPFLAEERIIQQYPDGYYNIEYAKKITIGSGVWVASNVTICGGVTIGDNVVIASGAVVTRDVPPNTLVGGVPAKVIRELNESDRLNVWEVYSNEK